VELVTPEKACKRKCLSDGTDATCAERIRWVSAHKTSSEVNPCAAAQVVVEFDCIGGADDSEDDSEDVCGGCTPEWAMCGLSDSEIAQEEERRRNKAKKPEVQKPVTPAPVVQTPVVPQPAAPAQADQGPGVLPPTLEEIRKVQVPVVPVVGAVQPPVNSKGQLPGTAADLGSELDDLDLNLLVKRSEEKRHAGSVLQRSTSFGPEALLGGVLAFGVAFVALRVHASRRTALLQEGTVALVPEGDAGDVEAAVAE